MIVQEIQAPQSLEIGYAAFAFVEFPSTPIALFQFYLPTRNPPP